MRATLFATRHQSSLLWSSMIMALAEGGKGEKAMDLFRGCKTKAWNQTVGLSSRLLSPCSGLASKPEKTKKLIGRQQQQRQRWLETGMELQSRAAKLGFEIDIFVANTLVDMYSKCKRMDMARRVLKRIQQRTIVGWNAIIGGYVEAGESHTALELFQRLQQQQREDAARKFERLVPHLLVPALKACAMLALLEVGRKIHASIREAGLSDCVLLANALIEVWKHGRCLHRSGSLEQLLAESVLETFERMRKDRSVAPDGTTFLWLLSACSHSGAASATWRSWAIADATVPAVFLRGLPLLRERCSLGAFSSLLLRAQENEAKKMWRFQNSR